MTELLVVMVAALVVIAAATVAGPRLGVAAPLVLVAVGVYAQLVWLGGIGFALLVAGAVLALAPVPQTLSALDDTGRPTVSRRTGRPGAGRRDRSRSEFMSMLEDRWERRRNGW